MAEEPAQLDVNREAQDEDIQDNEAGGNPAGAPEGAPRVAELVPRADEDEEEVHEQINIEQKPRTSRKTVEEWDKEVIIIGKSYNKDWTRFGLSYSGKTDSDLDRQSNQTRRCFKCGSKFHSGAQCEVTAPPPSNYSWDRIRSYSAYRSSVRLNKQPNRQVVDKLTLFDCGRILTCEPEPLYKAEILPEHTCAVVTVTNTILPEHNSAVVTITNEILPDLTNAVETTVNTNAKPSVNVNEPEFELLDCMRYDSDNDDKDNTASNPQMPNMITVENKIVEPVDTDMKFSDPFDPKVYTKQDDIIKEKPPPRTRLKILHILSRSILMTILLLTFCMGIASSQKPMVWGTGQSIARLKIPEHPDYVLPDTKTAHTPYPLTLTLCKPNLLIHTILGDIIKFTILNNLKIV